jgi:hypothetical protein
MSTKDFLDKLKVFLLATTSLDLEETPEIIEFEINIQPNFITFNGEYITKRKTFPLNLKKLNKSENAKLTENIELFHRQHTNSGLNKWNKAKFKLHQGIKLNSKFIWDKEWEKLEQSQRNQLTQPSRWYWDEK